MQYLSTNPMHDFGLVPLYTGDRTKGSDGHTYEVIDVQKAVTTLKSVETGEVVTKSSSLLISKGFAPILADGSHASGVRLVTDKAACNVFNIPYQGEGK
jgi:hypothetical protein